jgi:phenylacetate-CoA ligase
MAIGLRRPWQAVDLNDLVRHFPPPPEYFESAYFAPPDQIDRMQLARLRERALTASQVPFFARRWKDADWDPRELRSIDDLWRAPSYTIDDIRDSIEKNPPWGDYQGVTPERARQEPMRIFMSGGTTGASRPTFYTQWDREVHAILTARVHFAMGVRPGDVVLNSWLYGTHNGAFGIDEGLYRWLNCVILTTSTGTVTATEKQIELAMEYSAASVLATGDYLLRLADVARSMGLDPINDLKLKALATIGDPKPLEETFGRQSMQAYGFHELGWIAVECPARQGLHIFEDAVIVQIVDPDTGEPLPDGELGSVCVTEIYKTGSPQFRYNVQDLSYIYPREQCACGSWLRRMAPFAGRGDNMVKLRGINVWPEAIGDVLQTVPSAGKDYFVRAIRSGSRDELIASVVSDQGEAGFPAIQEEAERRLRDRLGVAIAVDVVKPGELDELTEIRTSPKPKRFRDDR